MDMLIAWTGMVSIVAIICSTALAAPQQHYQSLKEQRLDRLLQQPELLSRGEDRQILEEIASIANHRATTNSVGSDILDTLVEHRLITAQRARYIKE